MDNPNRPVPVQFVYRNRGVVRLRTLVGPPTLANARVGGRNRGSQNLPKIDQKFGKNPEKIGFFGPPVPRPSCRQRARLAEIHISQKGSAPRKSGFFAEFRRPPSILRTGHPTGSSRMGRPWPTGPRSPWTLRSSGDTAPRISSPPPITMISGCFGASELCRATVASSIGCVRVIDVRLEPVYPESRRTLSFTK